MTMRLLFSMIVALWLLLTVAAGSPVLALELPVKTDGVTGARVDQTRVRGLLEAFLAARTDVLPAALIRIKSLGTVRPFTLPAGEVTCEVVPADPAIIGSRSFSLIFRVDGRVRGNLALRTRLEAFAPVAVAAIDLPRGAVVAPGDLRLVERDLGVLREPFLEAESLVGKRVRRALRAGEVLHKGLIETPPVVRRGDLVTMKLRSGGLLLTAQGRARDNGVAGETIRVRNSASNKEVLCRVAGPGLVDVEI